MCVCSIGLNNTNFSFSLFATAAAATTAAAARSNERVILCARMIVNMSYALHKAAARSPIRRRERATRTLKAAWCV